MGLPDASRRGWGTISRPPWGAEMFTGRARGGRVEGCELEQPIVLVIEDSHSDLVTQRSQQKAPI